jgi:hypothetical protein
LLAKDLAASVPFSLAPPNKKSQNPRGLPSFASFWNLGVRPKSIKSHFNSIYSKSSQSKEKKSAHPKMGKPGI